MNTTERQHLLIPIKGGVFVRLDGSIDDAQVTLETPKGIQNLNELAPKDTTFRIVPETVNDQVLTSNIDDMHYGIKGKSIFIPMYRQRARNALPYAILHGIVRLKLHEDAEWHMKSTAAHRLLNEQLASLQAYGRVDLNVDGSVGLPSNLEEIRAWKTVCSEERKTSELAIGSLKDLRKLGINPLPFIKNTRDLTHFVNHINTVARTSRQVLIDPRWTGQQFDIPMTLPGYWVAALM